ncbi:Hydrolase, alpha/beta hydrolase fold family [Paramicrosporidium saccamoebae]|uniref:Hydrolase, alpha/beta hydrolase fold family n=1 Tax=Paramicrosporidium saccamoebae TaxID=1246581 RepID=A0A2H9TMB7_9FUNG|nr:Hydrolase, alpha/beta hydrolase fold family [Paramicrosporidium saccamoebae]
MSPNPSFVLGSRLQSLASDCSDHTTQYGRFWGEVLQKINLGNQDAVWAAYQHWESRPASFTKGISRAGAEAIVIHAVGAPECKISGSLRPHSSLFHDFTLEEVATLRPEVYAVFMESFDLIQLQTVSADSLERLAGYYESLPLNLNWIMMVQDIPYNWFTGEFGNRLFAALHAHGLLYRLPFTTLSSLLSTERFCSLLKAEYIGFVETLKYPLDLLSAECVAQIQNLDSVALAPEAVRAMNPAAFSKVRGDLHPGTILEMSEQQQVLFNYNEFGFQAMDRAGRINWQDLLSTVDNLRILPRIFEPYDIAYPIPEISLTKEIFSALAEHSPAIAGRLLAVLPVLPDDILSLCDPDVLDSLRAYRCLQPISSGIDVLGVLYHHLNSRQIIENLPSDCCEKLGLEDYVRYKWIRASLSRECRAKLHFKTDPDAIKQAPELADESRMAELLAEEPRYLATENELEDLVMDIVWTPCKAFPHPNVECSQGLLPVLSDHEPLSGEWIDVEVYRYVSKGSTPISKVIMLAGGPGASVLHFETLTNQVLSNTNGSVAVYHYEHRGIGKCGFRSDHIYSRPLHDIISTAPFDMECLTVENAALDVSLFAKAIEHDFPAADTRIGLFGVSYGAALAHHAVQLFPNMFDFAVIAGVPPIPGETGIRSYNGLLLHCQMDEFCKSKIGTVADFEAVIKEVASNRHLNECTEYLHERLNLEEQWTVGTKIQSIGDQLVSEPAEAMTARYLLPTIKATFDCLSVGAYKRAFHNVMDARTSIYTPAPLKRLTGHHGQFETNHTILDVVSLDYRLKDMKFNLTKAQEDCLELFPILGYARAAYGAYSRVGECLAGRRISQIKPAVTGKTTFVVVQNLLDLVTPFGAGRELFAKIEAPHKWFIRMNNLQHRYPNALMGNLIQRVALGESSILDSLQATIDATDVPIPNFWELPDLPEIGGIWDLVSSIEHKVEALILPPSIVKMGSIKVL